MAIMTLSADAYAQEKSYRGVPAQEVMTQHSRKAARHYVKPSHNSSGLQHVMPDFNPVKSKFMAQQAAPSRVTIAGYIPGKGNLTNGIYSFDVNSDPALSLVFHDDEGRMSVDGGGTYYDGKYYYVEWHYGLMSDEIYAHYGVVETENWTELYRSAMDNNPIDEHSIATDLTFCPVDKKIYGIFEDYDVISDAYTYYFGYLNNYGERVGITQLDKRYWAIAADANGGIFAIDENGLLCAIDRASGAVTKIGDTGIEPYYLQSACFDFRTGTMYWIASGKNILNALYTVNTSTGAVTKVCNIPGDEQMLGIYVVDHSYADEAPYKPAALTAEFENGNLSGKVSFTMPTATYAGQPLNGSLGYTVTLNGTVAATGTAQAGAPASADVTAPAAGTYEIAVSASNAAGEGPAVKTSAWIGDDIPMAPKSVSAVKGTDKVTVTWEAPTTTAHGGFLNPDALRYMVVRFPDKKILSTDLAATTITDINMGVPIKAYWYEITAMTGTQTGGAATSNNLVFGSHYEVPYFEDFSSADTWSTFTTIDVNDDGKEWLYYKDNQEAGCAAPGARERGDDWLITAPIFMSADKSFILSFDARSMSSTYAEEFEVAIGTSPEAAAMGRLIVTPREVKSSTYVTFEEEFTVPSDGLYYIGFHAISPKYRNWIFIDNIYVLPGADLLAPAAVTDLTATPAPRGQLSATISFNAPAVTAAGDPLTAIESISLYNGANLIHEFEAPAPGSALTWTDNTATQGENEYAVIVTAGGADSQPAVITAWVGIDIPCPVTGIVAKDNGNGQISISWNPVTEGVHGGYIDPSQIYYYVARSSDTQPFANQLTGTSVTDTDNGNEHRIIAYLVTALTYGGQADWAMSNLVAIGTPHTLPYAESFRSMALEAGPWATLTTVGNGAWELKQGGFNPYTQGVQDDDGGMIAFVPAADGDEGWLHSGKFDISQSVSPALSFYYFNNPGNNGLLEVMISKNGGDFEPALTVDFNTATGSKAWTRAEISLSDYMTGCRYLRIAFRAVGAGGKEIYVDNIRLFDNIDNDLTVTDIKVPSRLTFQKHALIDVTVKNIGKAASGAFTVNLFRNDVLAGTVSVTDALAPEATKTVVFEELPTMEFGEQVTYYAVVEYAADENTRNNTSESVTVKVKQPTLPAVTDLAVSVDGTTATLTWSEPSADNTVAESVTEDFESYNPFIITGMGDWLTIDRDGYETVGIQYGSYPNMFEAKSWMVFNPTAAGLSVTYEDGTPNAFAPASGAQYITAFCSVDPKTQEDMPNDDWIISPELSGTAQTITFEAKRLGLNYPESVEVYASSKTDDIADFTRVYAGSDIVGYEEWSSISVPLPEGTRYFAIRCNSYGGFCLMIDDITYVPASEKPIELSLTGYNIYRDDVKLNDTPVTETTYVNTLGDTAEHIFHVTALYDKGESAASNKVSTLTGSVDGITTGGITISAGTGVIAIANAAGVDISVYTADGRTAYAGEGTDMTFVHVPAGIYVVRAGATIAKVAVK